jgi:8-oxo-dGTP pyrophosphatase MutT (NUDIX family)
MIDALWRLLHRFAARLYDVRNFVLRPRVSGAVVLVRVRGELLLIRSSYRPWYTVPGGRMQRGEQPRVAALRELAEEVGLAPAPGALRALGEFVVHHSNIEDHVHAFELRLEAHPALEIDSREIVWAGFYAETALEALELWPALPPILSGSRPETGTFVESSS